MYWDWTYVIIVLPMVIISMIAQMRVNSTYSKYSKVYSKRGMTASAVARMILNSNGLSNVRIERVAGNLTDHYDPKTDVVRLSDSVFDSTSVAAIGVAAHEVGHAVQHAQNYVPVKIRTAIVPITQIGSKLSTPIIIIGLILGLYELAYVGVLLFGLVVLFQLVTLPTEFNASRRALSTLSTSGYLDGEELSGSKKVLSAAAMTYLAALFVSLAYLLRFLIIINGRNDRRR